MRPERSEGKMTQSQGDVTCTQEGRRERDACPMIINEGSEMSLIYIHTVFVLLVWNSEES
jgi:hypothetical protein